MTQNLTVTATGFKDLAASYTYGFEASHVQSIYTRPTADTAHTATTVIIYNAHDDSAPTMYGVSQSITAIMAGFATASQAEIDAIETAVALSSAGAYVAPTGTSFLDATTTDMAALVALDLALGTTASPTWVKAILTPSGAVTGLIMSGTATTGINISATVTSEAIKIAGATGVGIYINKTANTAGTLKIHCHALAAAGVDAPNHYANEFKGEFLAVASQTTCDGIAAHFHSAASGATIMRSVLGVAYLDSGVTMTGTNAALNGWINGGMFVADVAGVLAGTTVVAGLYAGIGSCSGGTLTTFSNMTSLYVSSNRLTAQGTGTTSLIYVQANPGVGIANTDYGILMEANSKLTTGIQITGTLSAATSKAITSRTTISAANLGDGVGANEFELSITGTSTSTAASSSWVNIITGTATGLVCAQTNGVYEEATGTISGATVIFGMRMQSLLAEAPAESYPFSCVSNTNIITALFSCNAGSSDMGTVTDTSADTGMLVPLYKETSTGTTYYVKLWSLT